MKNRPILCIALSALSACTANPQSDPRSLNAAAATGPGANATYWLYVANESADLVSRVAFTPASGVRVAGDVPVGIMPADIDGPHGLAVAPDGRAWFVSVAHGTPNGRVWKYTAGVDTAAGRVELGNFPASMTTTADGQFLYVANFNLHGDPVPSSVSIVYTPTMAEVARPVTCVMPHGGRINAAGSHHYSTCMHSDQLVEIDTRTFQVSRRFSVMPGHEGVLPLAERGQQMHTGTRVCSPTWAQPGRGKYAGNVYVPCNKSQEVLEIDLAAGQVTRRFASGKGPYNVTITPNGNLLLVTLKADQGVQIFELEQGREVARIATTQPITHGVVVAPDGNYAFVTNEAIGSTKGTVDVIDLRSLRRVASTSVSYQPGGIDFWRVTN